MKNKIDDEAECEKVRVRLKYFHDLIVIIDIEIDSKSCQESVVIQ